MRIGQLAQIAGIDTQTIRFYEQQGLLPPPERQENWLPCLYREAWRVACLYPPLPNSGPVTDRDSRATELSGRPSPALYRRQRHAR